MYIIKNTQSKILTYFKNQLNITYKIGAFEDNYAVN